MSPASKSKLKDRKGVKEAQNSSVKLSVGAFTGNGVSTNAYNPSLGTFHTLEPIPDINSNNNNTSASLNGSFRSIDDAEEYSGPSPCPEYDSVSNNGSWSGESEDPREKPPNPTLRPDSIPGAADGERREKIRQKNERKHLRQKERRAQELHERCCGYMMSRKLESLAQKLVAMGFSSERATMALILNEGKLEESVTWLFEGHDEEEEEGNGNGNLKLDISKELARIDEMQTRYGFSRQEVERAIVACEGDVRKAGESLKSHKPDPDIARVLGTPPIPPPPVLEKNGAAAKKMIQSGLDLARAGGSEKKWLGRGGNLNPNPGVNVNANVNETRPVIMMQRPKSSLAASSSGMEMMKSNGQLLLGNDSMKGGGATNTGITSPSLSSSLSHHHHHYDHRQVYVQNQQQQFNPGGSGRSVGAPCMAVAPASSLGLFSGLSISGPSSTSPPVDWSTGSTGNFDYSSIDWSLDRGPKPNGVWMGLDPSALNNPAVRYNGGQGGGRRDPEGSSKEDQGQDLLRHFVPSPYR